MKQNPEEWYLYKNNQQYGPYTEMQVKSFIKEGRIFPGDLVWNNTLIQWTKIEQVPGLLTPLHTNPPAPTFVSEYESASESKSGPASESESASEPESASLDLGPKATFRNGYAQGDCSENSKFSSHQKPKPKQKLLMGALSLIVLIAGLVTLFTTVIGGDPSGDMSAVDIPSIGAVTSRGVKEDSTPIGSTDTFSQEDKEIFVSVEITGASEGSVLSVDWWQLQSTDTDPDDTAYSNQDALLAGYSEELSQGNSRTHFSIIRPPFGWEGGEYQISLIVDERPLLTQPFLIVE